MYTLVYCHIESLSLKWKKIKYELLNFTQDDPNLFGYNVDERVNGFVKGIQQQADNYATNHIMLTMGSDFNYENAVEWFKNLDKLITYTNKMVRN